MSRAMKISEAAKIH